MGRQTTAAGQTRFAGRRASKPAAFLERPWPRRPVDRPINTAAAEQAFIGGVDDCIDRSGPP
jgi:hypothetical protein